MPGLQPQEGRAVTWTKFDDRYDDTGKVKRAWRRNGYAVGLHAMAATACSRHESDGLVDPEWLSEKLGALPARARNATLETAVDLKLFDPLPAGQTRTLTDTKGFSVTVGPLGEDAYLVHDYLVYNDSSAYLSERRRKEAVRKAEQRAKHEAKLSGRTPAPVPAESQQDNNGTPVGRDAESEDPDPTRPDPTLRPPRPPDGGRKRDRDQWKETALAWAASAGVTGDPSSVLRALNQVKPWDRNGDAGQQFRAFVAEHFSNLTAEKPAA
jgi:hypothetical protein